jgi:hypothetical protein
MMPRIKRDYGHQFAVHRRVSATYGPMGYVVADGNRDAPVGTTQAEPVPDVLVSVSLQNLQHLAA